MLDARVLRVRELLEPRTPESKVAAANFIISNCSEGDQFQVTDPTDGEAVVFEFVISLITNGCYVGAAHILWGKELFSYEPHSVQIIWEEIQKTAKLLIQGAGALGKSYGVAVWLLLDWLEDYEWTCIKVLSSTKEHAEKNVFAHIKSLHASAIITLPGERKATSIQATEDEKQGIHLVAIPQGEEGKGRLRGFHPVPRGAIHPKYGVLSRIRAILDECEEIPEGVWEDVDNMLITLDGIDHVKVIGASNPKRRTSKFGQRCEPEDSWESVNIEDSEKWNSRLGWRVVRLDGAKCENVIQRKVVYPGLLTWDGYNQYLIAGTDSPEYSTMARGWFPTTFIKAKIIPLHFLEKAKGTYVFVSKVINCASLDPAFEGDIAALTIGKFGKASGYVKWNGEQVTFDKLKDGLQIEQQFSLPKEDTVKMADRIVDILKNLYVPPAWFSMDRTGNATGLYDVLRIKYGTDILGVNYAESATDTKLFEESTQTAKELYDGIATQLWFTTRNLMEADAIKFSPQIQQDPLFKQLTDREYGQSSRGKLLRAEGKKEYMSRGNKSPDHGDSVNLMSHNVLMNGDFIAELISERSIQRASDNRKRIVDKLKFVNFDA